VDVVRTVGVEERRARLAVRHRHLAATRTDDLVALTDGLVALHSTDPVTVYLSAAARMRSPRLAALDEALYRDRTLVRHHAMRRTLWVFGHDAARAAHQAATLGLVRVQRRLLLAMLDAAGIVDPDRWLSAAGAEIVELLVDAGPLTAREIGGRLPACAVQVPVGSGTFAATQAAHSRVLLLLGFEGRAVRARPTGTWINGQYRWAASGSWFPGGFEAPDPDPRSAAAELARRWLWTFGPGTRTDLQWWAGWTVATTKRALADVGAVEVELAEGPGYLLPDDLDEVAAPGSSTALLPGLDPSTMGWKQRAFHLDAEHVPVLFDRNGNGGPTAWVNGRIVGGWVQRRDGEIALRIMTDVGAEATDALRRQAGDLQQLLGDVRFSVRFPAPLQTELSAAKVR
jgi:Winged helix DNA-binding domain